MSRALVLVDANGLNPLLARLEAWPKLPPSPAERTCIFCRCTESRGCPAGCAWQDLEDGSNWGVCTFCVDEKLCHIGGLLVMSAFTGDRWKRKPTCVCPICKAAAPKKRRARR